MADGFAAPPVNSLISITPLTASPTNRDATAVPAQLANVQPGTLVEGFVVNRDAQSNPVLRTILGDILVKSDVFIKTGSTVVFRVDTTQAGHARILTIDGLPPQDYTAMHTRGLGADSVNASQMATAARATPVPLLAALVNTTPLTAAQIASNPLLASVAAGATPVPTDLLKLQQGAQLQVKLLQVALPNIGEQPQVTPNAPTFSPPAGNPPPRQDTPIQQGQMANAQVTKAATQQQVPLPQTPLPNATPAPAAPIPTALIPAESLAALVQAGVPVDALANIRNEAATAAAIQAKVTEAKLPLPGETAKDTRPQPNVPAPQNQAPSPAQQQQVVAQPKAPANTGGVPAYIIGHEKDGAAILQTPVGSLKIYLPNPLPVGTGLRLQLEPTTLPAQPQIGMPLPTDPRGGVTTLAQDWPALEEALALFPTTHEAARPIQQAIPEIGPKLTSGLLFFMAAVKTGDLKQWLGNRAVAALELRAPALAARLKTDMAQLNTLLVDSPLQQWNSAMVPLLYQGQLEHARLFFRDESEEQKQNKKGGGDQRFIVEVDLSHLGEVQFDGFVRKGGASPKQFDLIVRSGHALPGELQQQIRGTFDTAMQTSGIKGYLAFQAGSQHFVRPMASTGDSQGPQPILA